MNLQEALEAASDILDISLVRSVLDRHTVVDIADDKISEKALHTAANSGYELLVKALLDKGIAVDVGDSDGWTALHVAVSGKNQKMVEILLERKASVNIRTSERGMTPLHIAAILDDQEIAKLLLARGADTNITNEKGQTPLHIAVDKHFTNTAELLLSWGAETDVKNSRGETSLLVATLRQDRDMIQLLLRYGAYSYPNSIADWPLQKFWRSPLRNTEMYQSFYTFLLLAGVSVPQGIVLPEPLRIIQRYIEQTVSAWLAPLMLSPADCAALTSGVLRALRQLRTWLDAISHPKTQKFGGVLFEILISNESPDVLNARLRQYYHYKILQEFTPELQNKALLKRLWAIPKEMQEAVKTAFIPLPLLTLVADRVHIMYDLPLGVATYLVDSEQQHPKAHADFLGEIFTHNWFDSSCAPPKYVKTPTVEVATSSQQLYHP